jgi:hypothetical protein
MTREFTLHYPARSLQPLTVCNNCVCALPPEVAAWPTCSSAPCRMQHTNHLATIARRCTTALVTPSCMPGWRLWDRSTMCLRAGSSTRYVWLAHAQVGEGWGMPRWVRPGQDTSICVNTSVKCWHCVAKCCQVFALPVSASLSLHPRGPSISTSLHPCMQPPAPPPLHSMPQTAPRAMIFRRDQGSVLSMSSMRDMMRYNNWRADPLRQGASPVGSHSACLVASLLLSFHTVLNCASPTCMSYWQDCRQDMLELCALCGYTHQHHRRSQMQCLSSPCISLTSPPSHLHDLPLAYAARTTPSRPSAAVVTSFPARKAMPGPRAAMTPRFVLCAACQRCGCVVAG